MHYVPWLPSSVSEICYPMRGKYCKTRAICQSAYKDMMEIKQDIVFKERLFGGVNDKVHVLT